MNTTDSCGKMIESGQPARLCAKRDGHAGACADEQDIELYPALYKDGEDECQ